MKKISRRKRREMGISKKRDAAFVEMYKNSGCTFDYAKIGMYL